MPYREDILRIAEKHGAGNVRVFGSFARGEARDDSDLDVLIDPGPEMSLLQHVALMQDLEVLLGRSVDVVSARALHWTMRDSVLAEARPL